MTRTPIRPAPFKEILVWISMTAWALWFGATIAVFVFGTHFFHALPTPIFREAAHSMFQVFATYELVLAGIALLASGVLLVLYPSKWSVLLVGCLVLAGGMAVTVALGLMPLMESLRNDGRVDTAEFRTLHGKSMIALAIQAGVLLLSGLVIMKSAGEQLITEKEQELEPQLHTGAHG